MQTLLIGIDDTDNLDSRGTGFRARELGKALTDRGLASLRSITRHQLFVSPEIPYTSHNSSACLEVTATPASLDQIKEYCRDYLLRESAPGADAGLCVAWDEQLDFNVVQYGHSAKHTVLSMDDCRSAAGRSGIHVEGLTGTHQGMIGSLAAVGLHHDGNDGRFLWLRGLREIEAGTYTIAELRRLIDVDAYETVDGRAICEDSTRIRVTEWA